jgi:hypothetical protein
VKIAIRIARYLIGAAAAWLAFPAVAGLIYVALLAVSLTTGADSGGPLAAPFLIVAAALLGIPFTVAVLFPAVLCGELIARRTRWWWTPVTTLVVAAALLLAVAAAWSGFVDQSPGDMAISWLVLLALNTIPLALFGTIAPAPRSARTMGWSRSSAAECSRALSAVIVGCRRSVH